MRASTLYVTTALLYVFMSCMFAVLFLVERKKADLHYTQYSDCRERVAELKSENFNLRLELGDIEEFETQHPISGQMIIEGMTASVFPFFSQGNTMTGSFLQKTPAYRAPELGK